MKARVTITLDLDVDGIGEPGRVEDAIDELLDDGQLQELIQDAARDHEVDVDFLATRCTMEPLIEEDPPRPRCVVCSQPIEPYMHYYEEAGGRRHATAENCKPVATTVNQGCDACKHLAPHVPSPDGTIWCCEAGCLCNGKDATGNADPRRM